MTKLPEGVEKFLERLCDPNCEPNCDETDKAAALIRAQARVIEALTEAERAERIGSMARISAAQLAADNAESALSTLIAEIEKHG